MSENTKIVVGLKEEKIKKNKNKLFYASYGYENGEVWEHVIEAKESEFFQSYGKQLKWEDDNGNIYGIAVVGSWNGAIDLEEISDLIKEAEQLFENITGQIGKVYLVCEQV